MRHSVTSARCRAGLSLRRSTDIAMDVDALLVRAVAPAHLADAIIGDLSERRTALAQTHGHLRARAICRAEALRSLPSLATHNALRSLEDNWRIALVAAAAICALCVVTIPLWDQIGMGGAAYHVLRLAIIGLVLGCIPRASTLSCAFLLLLIAITNGVIDARELDVGWRVFSNAHLYVGLFVDGAAMASALLALRITQLSQASLSSHWKHSRRD